MKPEKTNQPNNINTQYSMVLKNGDSWTVKYEFTSLAIPPAKPTPDSMMWYYRVISFDTVESEPVITVSIQIEPDMYGKIKVTLKPCGTMIRLTKIDEDGDVEFEIDNPSPNSSYLYYGFDQPPLFIDFVCLPPLQFDKDIAVQSGQRAFITNASIQNKTGELYYSMWGNIGGKSIYSEQIWEPGGKWWHTCHRKIDNDIVIKGHIVR